MSQQAIAPPPSSLDRPSLPFAAPAVIEVAQLRRLVEVNARRWRILLILEGAGLAIALPLAYLWLVFFLDASWHLPVFGRLLASVGFVAGIAWSGRYLYRRWRDLRLTEDQVALAIEQRTPHRVHNRLINAVQLSRLAGTDQRALSEAVLRENCDRLRQIHLEQAAHLRPAAFRLGAAGLLIVIGLGFWIAKPALFKNTAARIFLPLAHIEPMYRTKLTVEMGKVLPGGLTVRVVVAGERPDALIILKRQHDKTTTESVPLAEGAMEALYTFREVMQPFAFAVRGGDYTSEFFHVTPPARASLAKVRAVLTFPGYTKLGAKTVETSGDLEALQGTEARVTWIFDQFVNRAVLSVDRPSAHGAGSSPSRQLVFGDTIKEWSGTLPLDGILSYRLEVTQGDNPTQQLGPFAVRILKDQEPKLELGGLEHRMEVLPDAVLPVQITASDDFGLQNVGLFYRKVPAEALAIGSEAADQQAAWQTAHTWDARGETAFHTAHELPLAALQAIEGDHLEIAVRGQDNDPLKKGAWTTGAVYEVSVGGEGVALQLHYERILRGEAQLRKLLKDEQGMLTHIVSWLRKLEGAGNLRWDDPKNIAALHTGIGVVQKEHDAIRQATSAFAKSFPTQTGNLRVAVGLLADTEMVRLGRIFEAVVSREQPQGKQAALADARVTQERILRSVEEMLEQYVQFRSDWELNNMTPFAKVLAERQAKLRDQSLACAAKPPVAEKLLRLSMARRQGKMVELCSLVQPAFAGLAARLASEEPILGKAFAEGAALLGGDPLKMPLKQAATLAEAGQWQEASAQQKVAAELLAQLHARLRQAQLEAAQKALALLKDKAQSDLEAQKELEKLDPGSADSFLKNFPDNMKLEDLLRIREVAGAKKANHDKKGDEKDPEQMYILDVDKKYIELDKDSGVRQDPYTLTLGKVAEKTPILKMYKDKDKNAVKPFIQEKFDDLVGKLLEEADELDKKYQKISLSTNRNNNDPGDISKVGGALNSTGAVTATGNKKPPTTESGGVSRTGRQGARAYGAVADEDSFNRKGRDKALDGQEKIADQAGLNKMRDTDENQKDVSTGVGGKKIKSDDNHFSLHDSGKWKDEYTKRLDKPQKKHYIVERQGDKLDAKTAAEMRDLTSKQEQVIERLKAIKKELKNLYLPTEHLDELAASLVANLDNLKERPDAENFRLQAETLERLRGALKVFQSASASFQPSVPRERTVQGRVLDEPAAPALPGYEEATKNYYLKLANP